MSVSTSQFDHYFIPAGDDSWKRRPKLMIVLHGRGDSLKPFRWIDEELGLPQMNYLLINAPRKYDGGYTWYAFPPNQRLGVLKARHRLRLLMAELEEQGWSSQDVFFLGFSQGSLVSCDFGMNYQKPLGGIIGISGYIYFQAKWRMRLPEAAFQTPWLITHGTEDIDLPIVKTRNQVRRMVDAGLPINWQEFDKEHEVEPDIEAPYIRQWVIKQARAQRRQRYQPRLGRARWMDHSLSAGL